MADNRNGNSKTPTKGGGAGNNPYAIDLNVFSQRLKAFYSHWNEHPELWDSSDVVAIATPPQSDEIRYLKSSALQMWLVGYDVPDTIMVFMKKQIHFLGSQKKVSFFQGVKKSAKEAVGVDVVTHVKAKNDDGSALMDAVLGAIDAQPKADGHDTVVVGRIAREEPEGNLLKLWFEKLKSATVQLGDVTNALSDLFAVKEKEELGNVKKAAYLSSVVMQKMVTKLESVIDDEKKISHSALMDETEKLILEPSKVGLKLNPQNVDICYPPIFQSGGKFDLRPGAASNDESLYYDPASVIICAIGSRYHNYCSNAARTFLIDANSLQSKAYDVLLKAHAAAISELKPGNKASAAYLAALSVVERDAPELVPNLTKSTGTGIGIEFRESGLNLNAKNDRVVKAGMVFNVALGFHNLQSGISNSKHQNFSLLLADTVVVNHDKPEVLTGKVSKAVKDVAYSFNEIVEERPEKGKGLASGTEALISKTTLRSENNEKSKEEQRRHHQAELARQKNEETARRLTGDAPGSGNNRSTAKSLSDLVAYKNVNDLSPKRDLMIQVDQNNEAVLLPIYGSMVPFHIATIKTLSVTSESASAYHYIRIIFNVPGTPFSPHDSNSLKNMGSIYLKEVTFRSKDQRHMNEVTQVIKNLRKKVVSRENERAERATLVTQERLQLAGNKFKPLRLSDLWIRPVFGGRGRKIPGTLEAHANGFRYSTTRQDERVDVMYANIKHAFFQPAENEMITLLHFHLHNHIMVGNKKTKDVQFYVEVMDVVQTLGGSKRSAYDPDEIEEEQRERARKNKVNTDFRTFVSRVQDLWQQPQFEAHELEFDQPLRDLGFHGVPYKSSAYIVPTTNCLVELIENPFLVVTLAEIEIVNLERVGLGQKNFDMAIVFKDFKKDVLRIDSIPSTSLEGIKEWLDDTEIKYYESRMNLSWKPILKTITEDPQSFLDNGGWEFLNLEGTDSDSDQSQESDQGYEPSDMEPESESEDDSSDSASLVESEDDEEEESEEVSEGEEGKTWEELEREASNADREKGNESDSEEERKRRKMKAFGKARAPPASSIPKRSKFRR
ncbi:FACT complex subunit SPT16-like [Argentina anserina]|uniref:FACT complex subunit SPT16-like n=1 Tax=Argentina anserina TaxID=57926 RepID=UPI0021765038|nr:FACT complex subunit SPT16-like [Potentilla anserina]